MGATDYDSELTWCNVENVINALSPKFEKREVRKVSGCPECMLVV